MLGVDGKPVTKKDLTLANKARDMVNASIRELTHYTGKPPIVVRVKPRYFLILTEVDWINSWPGIEVRAAP